MTQSDTSPDTAKRMASAIKEGDAALLRQLLDEDPARAAITLGDGLTPVLMALYHQKPELAEILQEHAGQLDWFSAAAVGNAARLTEHLSEDPNQVNTHASDGNTALHLAAYFCHANAVAALLSVGADPNAEATNRSKIRPIHSAVAGGSIEALRQLLDAGAEPQHATTRRLDRHPSRSARRQPRYGSHAPSTRRRPAHCRRQRQDGVRLRERASGCSRGARCGPRGLLAG